MIRLSIIIPYYNAEPYTSELLNVLDPQIRDDIEVIVVDDGSRPAFKTDHKWCKVIKKKNGGVSTARNRGLEEAKGSYIQFIDADDMVPDYFVEKLLEKIDETDADVIDHSWKSVSGEGVQHDFRLRSDDEWLTNPSVATRCFKRSFIGDVRFNEQKDSTEDEEFSRKLGYLYPKNSLKHASMTEYMYYYRTAVVGSKVKRFKQGLMNTKRITYYFRNVTKDMTYLLEEIREEDKTNEVWLLTEECEIPELKKYCQISQPINIWTHYLRGEPYYGCTIIPVPLKAQVVIYCEFVNKVGGISTFLYNFCQLMKEQYDLLLLYEHYDPMQLMKIERIVRCEQYSKERAVECDTLILNRLTDRIPENVMFKKSIQICHACSQVDLRIPTDRDVLINVSQAAKDTWGEEAKTGIVINNMPYTEYKPLITLISATRTGAYDKGQNDARMRKLASLLERSDFKWLWLNFSDNGLTNMPPSFVNMPATVDVQSYIKRADYLVQLSDQEAFCYSVVEALLLGTAVITTPLDVLKEIGFEDEKNGYMVPYDMEFDINKLLSIPKFEYHYDTDKRIRQWKKLLGKEKPFERYVFKEPKQVEVEVLEAYTDLRLGRDLLKTERLFMPYERAKELEAKGLVNLLGENNGEVRDNSGC